MANSEIAAESVSSSSRYAFHSLMSKANLSVTQGLALIVNGYGPIDYGALISGGSAATQTFTVYNNGSAPLLLGTPSMPAGFSITKPFAPILQPQTGDTFDVTMLSSTGGVLGGTISFGTNGESQAFGFSVFGRVLVPSDIVWVAFNWAGNELGTEPLPFNTSAEGVGLVNSGGTIKITASSTAETIRITKPVRIEAVGGTARIGRQ